MRTAQFRVDVDDRQRTVAMPERTVLRLLQKAAGRRWAGKRVSVALVGREEMIELNRQFTGRSGDTDVLAFELKDGPTDPTGLAGEIVVCADRAADEARARAASAEEELALYLVHGLLHLSGYDDHSAAERRRMYAAERAALTRAGFGYVRHQRRRHGRGKDGTAND